MVLALSYQHPSCPLCRKSLAKHEAEALVSEKDAVEHFTAAYQGQIEIEFTSV